MELSIEKLKKITALSDNNVIFQLENNDIQILYFSETLAALLGYSVDEFVQFKKKNGLFFNFESIDEIQALTKRILNSANTDESVSFSIYINHRSGEFVNLSGTSMYLGEHNDAPTFLGIFDDETGKCKNANLQLILQNEKKYKDIISFANILVWDYDIQSRKIINSNGFYEKFGIDAQSVVLPDDFLKQGYVATDSIEEFVRSFDMLSNGVREVSHECWFIFDKLSTPMYLKCSYVVDSENKNIAHAIGINLTDQKNAEIAFSHRTASILKMNKDSIATFHLNITKNEIVNYTYSDNVFTPLAKSPSMDEFLKNYINLINDKKQKITFINKFSRGSLVSAFNSGEYLIDNVQRLVINESNYQDYVKTDIHLVKNPVNGDIEGIMHLTNINEATLMDTLIKGTVDRDFLFIALLGLYSNRCLIIDSNIKPNGIGQFENFEPLCRENLKLLIQIPEERQRVLEEFTVENICKNLENNDNYIITFNTNIDRTKNRHIQLKMSYKNIKKTSIILTGQDITELYNREQDQKQQLKEALNQAQIANKTKSEFLSMVSHDIRTPLNGIMGMTNLALDEEMSDKSRNYLNKAQIASNYLQNLINDILDLGRIESGNIVLNSEEYNLIELNNYITSIIEPACINKDINLIINIDKNVDNIIVDKMRFNQIIINLLSNAVKYTSANGTIKMSLSNNILNDTTAKGTIIIEDNGIGISDEFKNHVFESFSQENREKEYSNIGSGLGLSIVKNNIEAMNGTIDFTSEINKGTRFEINICYPYSKNKGTNKTETSATDYMEKLSGRNILVVEDNEINMEITCQLLKNMNVNVYSAYDGVECLDIINDKNTPDLDLIIMDIRMPKMNGIEATKEIRKIKNRNYDSIPIIAITANTTPQDKQDCLDAGINAFLSKPIKREIFYNSILNIME